MAFGSFAAICNAAPLPLCALVGEPRGAGPACYARNIELANTLIFEGAAAVVQLAALVMVGVMLANIGAKYTAVGRREMATFLHLYVLLTAVTLVLDAGVVGPPAPVYAWAVAAQCGLVTATSWCLLGNGAVGFQLAEDGTRLSLALLRGSSLLVFLASSGVALGTFRGWIGSTAALFAVLYVAPAAILAAYAASQVYLVLATLRDRWPLFDIAFGVFFFALGQVALHALSPAICARANHYLDGLFFVAVANLLAVMMVYKVPPPACCPAHPQFWDSITKEDLEFSVSMKANVWEVKERLLPDDDRRPYDYSDSAASLQTSAYTGHPAHAASEY
ncbi:Chitin synthase export chaperone [Neolecta irregularis DAH-3]|uniref:Chitin synthase export chaperone n=1 Tax=Neolecta irregularis (strain DAH-3) TaxID=1198029 RepID=A0A1U7LTM6_NEOID|nr:Chitin synthase export chaperone [Neolecta irregularis DAH-3]|eukprot:OLL26020.1 Chitin synthase export chaperone [Neolecta irregularis DAH-3]